MKQMLLAALSALCLTTTAQVTIPNTYFPTVGDSLRYAIDVDPDAALIQQVTAPGGPQTWDFTAVTPDQITVQHYQTASEGQVVDQFPGAEMVVIGSDGESYFNSTSTNFNVMGFQGVDPGGLGINVILKFAPQLTERYAPVNFFDIHQQVTNLSLPLSTENLPDSLFAGSPIKPDSIRIRINTQRLDVCDAYGNAKIPGGDYPVLRIKRTEYTTTAIDVKLPFLGWVDLGQLIGGGGGGGGFGQFLGTDTTLTYQFYSPGVKEAIALMTLNNAQDSVAQLRVKTTATSGTEEVLSDDYAPGAANVFAFPNPAVETVNFHCVNLPKDEYTLKIFNIVGKQVWKETHEITGNKSLRVDLDAFKKGTYLYTLVNKKGTVIGTKRLVIVKP